MSLDPIHDHIAIVRESYFNVFHFVEKENQTKKKTINEQATTTKIQAPKKTRNWDNSRHWIPEHEIGEQRAESLKIV